MTHNENRESASSTRSIVVGFSVCAVALIACAGCGASGAAFSERSVPPGKSLIYVYREPAILGGGRTYRLFANGQELTRVTNGGYYDFVVDPGRIEFTQLVAPQIVGAVDVMLENMGGPHSAGNPLQAEADHVYYFKFGAFLAKDLMSQVSNGQAVKAMAGMHRFDDAKPASQ